MASSFPLRLVGFWQIHTQAARKAPRPWLGASQQLLVLHSSLAQHVLLCDFFF
jgi:hypothetical protein